VNTKESNLDPKIREALAHPMGVIDITTMGRQSGQPRRIEIVFHRIKDRIYISGQPFPNRRAWLGNLDANPHLTLHLKGPVSADIPATARIITDVAERRTTLVPIAKNWKRDDVDVMVEQSPLIEVTLDGQPG